MNLQHTVRCPLPAVAGWRLHITLSWMRCLLRTGLSGQEGEHVSRNISYFHRCDNVCNLILIRPCMTLSPNPNPYEIIFSQFFSPKFEANFFPDSLCSKWVLWIIIPAFFWIICFASLTFFLFFPGCDPCLGDDFTGSIDVETKSLHSAKPWLRTWRSRGGPFWLRTAPVSGVFWPSK